MRIDETSWLVTARQGWQAVGRGMTYYSQHRWEHDGRRYEANNFHLADFDGWCYEVYELVEKPDDRNDYVEFRIPDVAGPDSPFAPASSDQVMMLAHGEPQIPLPILRRVLGLMAEQGHLVD